MSRPSSQTRPSSQMNKLAESVEVINLEGPFNLTTAIKQLSGEECGAQALARIEGDEEDMRKLRKQIVLCSKKSFILERELEDIDEKIKLLIKNRITVQEVLNSSSGLSSEKNEEEKSSTPLEGKRDHYEDLFYLLQHKPLYFAKLARLLEAKHIPSFVQTVVFDMYGDQYDTREERLLLSLFRMVLQAEFDAAKDQGSLMRANTAITNMLSAYARRGQGLLVLKGILEKPLKELTNAKDLNLEINPQKVYTAMIQEHETRTGQKSPLPAKVDDDTATANEEVQAIIEERTKELLARAKFILHRITDGVAAVPYGMRWICKQLGDLSKERFPNQTKNQVGNLIGGYIYLRFFNPVVVTPDAIGFVDVKPTRAVRRNLILVAKVLQNLSNGIFFGDKEIFMRVCNPFLEKELPRLHEYFGKLTAVDDLEDSLQMDKYLEHTGTNTIALSLNQIFLIHSLCENHIDELCTGENKENDAALRQILRTLGRAPAQLPREAGKRAVGLHLVDRRNTRIETTAEGLFVSPEQNPVYRQTKKALLAVMSHVDTKAIKESHTLMTFLQDEKEAAEDYNNKQLAAEIGNVLALLPQLQMMGLLDKSQSSDEAIHSLLWRFAEDSATRDHRQSQLNKRLKMITFASETINSHHLYLTGRLEVYRMYLDNVRKQQSVRVGTKKKKKKKKKKDTDIGEVTCRFSHHKLEELGVVARTNEDVKRGVLKKCYYIFSMLSTGVFHVDIYLKKGVEVSLLKKPVKLVLEDLLKMQEHGTVYLELDYVSLNVNLLIHLLNTHFLADK